MSGHSKWSTIKHKKAAKDAKKGKIFTKIIRELTVAARSGGSDPEGNPKLRTLITKAKQAGMNQDNITRACKKGAGELEGANYEEVLYEGYGPGGVAILIESLTDNRQRTVMELRHTLSRNSGNLGTPGCVSFMFQQKGLLLFPKDNTSEDALMEKLLDAGVENIATTDDGDFEVTCDPGNFEAVKAAAEAAKLEFTTAELTRIPTTTVKLTGDEAQKMMKLVDALDDLDDVQNVHANFDIATEELEQMEAS